MKPRNTSEVVKNGKDSSKIWNERTGSLLSFDEDSHGRTNFDDMSLLDTTLKDLEEKSAEVVALQREINDINAALKVCLTEISFYSISTTFNCYV